LVARLRDVQATDANAVSTRCPIAHHPEACCTGKTPVSPVFRWHGNC
jgi:hypothetical protein